VIPMVLMKAFAMKRRNFMVSSMRNWRDSSRNRRRQGVHLFDGACRS
jgi:hypothetical protein